MFEAGKGLFHFVFANRDDDFYTSSYIKMSFEPYLRYKLIKKNYRYLCFLGREHYKMGKEYRLDLIGGIGTEILDQVVVEPVKKNKGLFENIFGKKNKPEAPSRIGEINHEEDFRIEHVETNFQTLTGYFNKILGVMSQKKGVAVVIPIDIFTELTENADIVKMLLSLQSGYNIILITSSVKALENDLYFKNSSLEYHSHRVQSERTSIFFNAKMFPEIEKAFSARTSDSTSKLVFIYDKLKFALGERMVVWNSLPYEHILKAVRYTFMHFPSLPIMRVPEQYAAVIWAWYENDNFREKHIKLNLPLNELRKTKEITDILQQKEYIFGIEKVIDEECSNVQSIKAFCERLTCEDKPIYIVYETGGRTEKIELMIVQQLIRFKKVVSGHENILDDEALKRVSFMIRQFSKPSYQSVNNKAELPHVKFKEEENKKLLSSLFSSLEEKSEWNSWDDGSMYLLYVLFWKCYTDSMSMCDNDFFNSLGELRFNRCMEALRYCMKNSRQIPFNTEKACSFTDTTAGKLENADQKELKKYIILLGD